jgi:hypothetical protein
MIYELRTYICVPGRLDDVVRRFQQPVLEIWKEMGIEPLGFWTGSSNGKDELVYILRWESDAQRAEKMGAFAKDQRWLDAKDSSEKDGPIVESFSSKSLHPTEFSSLR